MAADEWDATLRENAADYARVALSNVYREFPSDVWHRMQSAEDLPPTRPRERTPVFYGSFDWHSCVEMHWVLVRLLRTVPEAIPTTEVRHALNEQFTSEGLAAEARFIGDPRNRNRERPYGWGWALQLIHDVQTWPDHDAQRWTAHFEPLAQVLTANFLDWLPRATYPIRYGVHGNSAFGISRSLPYAGASHPDLHKALVGQANAWFSVDTDYPAAWEPSGADFLSPALCEAELMAQLMTSKDFAAWLERFLPHIARAQPASIFTPATVSDSSDGQIAHLHGLNLSRAWCWRRIAESLPPDDPRVPIAREAMRRHAAAALPHVTGDDYMVEHWLAAYAVLLMT
ncbi:MAG: DUF2891 domain-containing protein [Chloroflexi bacterium]|nr:DUF2891 domain-containing protein [Chloroflexota bacterium]